MNINKQINKMNKKLKLLLIGFLLGTFIFLSVQLLVGYFEWESNPGKWGEQSRSVGATIGGLLFFLGLALPSIIDDING